MYDKNTDIRFVDAICDYLPTMPAPWGLLPSNPRPQPWVNDGRKVSASWRSRLKQLCNKCDLHEAE